jgi:hypothetical protein
MNMDCFLKRYTDILLNDKEDSTFQMINFLVGGTTSYRTGKLLNFAVSQMSEGECYVETGVFQGATLISANYRNGRPAFGIDPYIGMVERADYASVRDRARNFVAGMGEGAKLIEKDFRVVTKEEIGMPIGVTFIDAMHTYKDVTENLEWVYPLLADNALLIFDDVNFQEVGDAIFDWIKNHPYHFELTCFIKPFYQNADYLWSLGDRFLNNGVCIIRYHQNPMHTASYLSVKP